MTRILTRTILFGLSFVVATSGAAQLLPRVPQLPPPGGLAGELLPPIEEAGRNLTRRAQQLARDQVAALEQLVRANSHALEMTREGPAVRGEIVALDPSPPALATIEAAGFTVIGSEQVEGLGFTIVTLRVPSGLPVDRAVARVRRLVPGLEISANHLHFASGSTGFDSASDTLAQRAPATGPVIGLIDGGVAVHPTLRGAIEQRSFAGASPRPSPHGTAVASLIAGEGSLRGSAPGAHLKVADIFSGAWFGGSATALVRALNWMVGGGVRVVAVSLAGPHNPIVGRAVAEARRRGTYVVAPVGNAGPAAPPAYPAAYPDSIAVTGVDARGRVLIEAGRTPRLAYAAPGADMAAAHPGGGLTAVRGTSFAVPLVAGRLARHLGAEDPLAALDREASTRERRYGRGLICATCRTPPPRNSFWRRD